MWSHGPARQFSAGGDFAGYNAGQFSTDQYWLGVDYNMPMSSYNVDNRSCTHVVENQLHNQFQHLLVDGAPML